MIGRGFPVLAVVIAALAAVPLFVQSNVVLNFMIVGLMIALAGQGWNVLGGYGGQYSFGHAAFFGTGAYTTAILQVRYGVNAWPGFALGVVAGALVGVVVGFLSFRARLRGSYFALVTLAFAEVLRIRPTIMKFSTTFDYIAAEGAVAEALGVAAPDLLQRAIRVRSIDGEPFSYLTTHIPEWVGITFSRQELASRPLLELLERSGVKVSRATQQIGAGLAGPSVAAALGVATGSPLIELTRLVYDGRGRAVEHLHALYRPDRYSLAIDLERSGGRNRKTWAPVMRSHPRKSKSTTTTDSVIS